MTSKTRRQNKQDPKFSEQDLEKTLRQNRSRTRSNKGTTGILDICIIVLKIFKLIQRMKNSSQMMVEF